MHSCWLLCNIYNECSVHGDCCQNDELFRSLLHLFPLLFTNRTPGGSCLSIYCTVKRLSINHIFSTNSLHTVGAVDVWTSSVPMQQTAFIFRFSLSLRFLLFLSSSWFRQVEGHIFHALLLQVMKHSS